MTDLEDVRIVPMTTTNDNKQLVQTFFDRCSAGDNDGAFSLVSDNVAWWVPGSLPLSGTKTKPQYLQIVNMIRQNFPTGFALKVTSMLADGNAVAAEVESEGTHVNGMRYENKYHFLFRIENGAIVHVKEYMDTLHLAQLLTGPKT